MRSHNPCDDLNGMVEVRRAQVSKAQQQPVATICPQCRFMARLDACLKQTLFKRIPFLSRAKMHCKVCPVAGCKFRAVDQRNQPLVEYFAPLRQTTVHGAR